MFKFAKWWKCGVLLMAIGVFVVIFSGVAFAKSSSLTDDEQVEYSLNNIVFYEPCGNSATEICGTNENYAGVQVFTDEQMQALRANSPYYQKAAEQYGFPWQLIAAIHMREHGLARSNPDNGQGVYQFAGESTREACVGGDFTPGAISEEQFQIQTNCVAKLIKENYGAGLDLSTDNGAKEMFYRYNSGSGSSAYEKQAMDLGFSEEEAKRGEGSPYVMNRYDEKREPSDSWGQIKKDGGSIEYPANNDFGAFVYYKAIACGNDSSTSGTTGESSCNSCVKGSKNINGMGVCMAWPYGTDDDKHSYAKGGSPTPLFKEAWDELVKKGTVYTGSSQHKAGAYCSGYTAAVVQWSGYDEKFPSGIDSTWESTQAYKVRNSDLWEVIEWNGDPSVVQGGDIINEIVSGGGHSYMVSEDENGEMWLINAHQGMGGHYGYVEGKFNGPYYSNAKGRWIIRATKANNSNAGVSVTKGVKTSSSTGKINNTGKGNLDIGATARYFAWPEGTEWKDWNKHAYRAEEWEKLREENGRKKIDINGELTPDEHMSMGRSCVLFVWGVLKYAGLSKNFGSTERLDDDELKKGGDWEKVGTGLKVSELEDGDVLVYYHSGSSEPYHYAIFIRDENNKGHIVEASLSKSNLKNASYGLVKEKLSESKVINATVYRNKKNKSGGSDCSVCEGGNEDGDVSLKDGGLSLEEAKKLVAIYKEYAGENDLRGNTAIANKYYIKVGCHGNLFLNCPSFVKYFVNRYTTKKWTTGLTGDGKDVYKYLAKDLGLQTGSEPRPYAVFSDDSYSPGHTGVVLGVDSAKGTMLIGEAGCLSGGTARQAYDVIGVRETPIKTYHLYTYLDPIINMKGN